MNETVIALVAGYAVLASLLLLFCLATKYPVWLKSLAIVLVGGFYVYTYEAMLDMLGWPTHAAMPERFMLLSSWVREPDKKTGDDGSIELWAVALDDEGPAQKPRAYTLGYDERLHQRLDEANRQMRNGLIQIGRAKRRENDAEAADSQRFADARQRIEFAALPDPELPEK